MTKVEQAQRKARGDGEAPAPAKQEVTAPSWRGKGKERGARTSVQSFRSRNTYLFLPVPTSSGQLLVSPINPNQEEA